MNFVFLLLTLCRYLFDSLKVCHKKVLFELVTLKTLIDSSSLERPDMSPYIAFTLIISSY